MTEVPPRSSAWLEPVPAAVGSAVGIGPRRKRLRLVVDGRKRLAARREVFACRRRAVLTARTAGPTEWKTQLEREVRAEEIRQVGAIRTDDDVLLVFGFSDVVEQEVAGGIA